MADPINSKVPRIRFKRFEREWEEKAFLEITTKIGSGKTPRGGDKSYVANGVPLIRSQNITDNSVLFEKIAFITKETDDEMANSRVKRNDVLLNITGASIGRSAVYRFPDIANVNQHVCIIRPTEDFNPDFLQLHLASTSGQKKIDNNQAGGAREGLNFQQIGGMSFHYPSTSEQTQIGGYFRELDRLIGLQQRKHDKLVTLRKAMLQRMFPQPGTTTPEIRFKGFEGAWEEKKLGELMEVGSVKRIHQSDWTKSGVRFLRARDLVSAYKGEKPSDILYISHEKYAAYSLLSGKVASGDLLVTGVGTIGVPYLIANSEPVYFKDGNIIWFKNNGALDGEFLYYSFIGERIQNYIIESAGTGTVGTYTISSGKSTPLAAPQMEEQRKIGHYFRTLDELISKHAVQLAKLKQLKSACLERMFV